MKKVEKISKLTIRILLLIVMTALLRPGKVNASDIVLSDKKLKVSFSSETGAITKMESLKTGWVIERRASLGISFRMHVPLPNRRFNYIYGQNQHAIVNKVSDNQIKLEWSNLKSENGGILPLTFDATITLTDGKLTFSSSLKNDSRLTVETIDYPYLGDLNSPAKDVSINARTMWYGGLESEEIYPHFENRKGYWGVFNPTKTKGSNRSLFCLLQTSANQGLYIGVQDPTERYYVEYTWVQHPANINSINSLIPQSDEIGGVVVNTEFRLCHFVFAAPHSTTDLIPILFVPYIGDWHAGVDIYKAWRETWFKKPNIPAWVKNVNSWMQLQINSPEDDWRVKFKDLYKYGQECKENGVTGIQLVGWNKLGQDGNDPSQDFEDHLGTWKDLHDAIQKIQGMGVHIILFGKINWADKTTKAYKEKWYKYEVKDPYGIPYEQGGYSYYTPTQLAGINNHRRAIMDFNAPGFQAAIAKEFEKVLDLNPSGWLFDENCHHGPALYNFAKDHGYTAPKYIYSGDMPLASKLNEMAFKRNPDFLFAGEGQMDWLLQNYQCAYFRMGLESTAVDRYIDSETPLVVAVTGADDREKLNLILMDKYIISYEPYFFKGHVNDFMLTLSYGKKIDSLRRKYKSWVWDAEFRDVLGASVTSDGNHRYSVFQTKGGKRAVVVANFEKDRGIHVDVRLDGKGNQQFNVVTPDNLNPTVSEGEVDIPARSVAVLMEK